MFHKMVATVSVRTVENRIKLLQMTSFLKKSMMVSDHRKPGEGGIPEPLRMESVYSRFLA